METSTSYVEAISLDFYEFNEFYECLIELSNERQEQINTNKK